MLHLEKCLLINSQKYFLDTLTYMSVVAYGIKFPIKFMSLDLRTLRICALVTLQHPYVPRSSKKIDWIFIACKLNHHIYFKRILYISLMVKDVYGPRYDLSSNHASLCL